MLSLAAAIKRVLAPESGPTDAQLAAVNAKMEEYWSLPLGKAGHPSQWLAELAAASGVALESKQFAAVLDSIDPLREYRDRFEIPQEDDKDAIYLCGNSLGAMPKETRKVVNGELNRWGSIGEKGHYTGDIPWATCEELLPELLGDIVGAEDAKLEVAVSNSLTVNLHMMMAAFYKPTATRNAVMIEAAAFPSDRYATASQVMHHGYDPKECLIEVTPSDDMVASTEKYGLLTTERIIAQIDANKDRLAVVMLAGVQYLTGQMFDMEAITAHVHKVNASLPDGEHIYIGWDLAHAVGNVPLKLHQWGADFAAFCSYKYLNSGAGCLSGFFVHSKHAHKTMKELPRFAGWWGVPYSNRFKMAQDFECAPGAPGFLCSNVPPLLVACIKPSLEIFRDAGGIAATRRKALLLTGYLEALLKATGVEKATAAGRTQAVEIVTPADPEQRGCQLSLRVVGFGGTAAMSLHTLKERLDNYGIVTDAREPDIVRVSPAPLYNTYNDVFTVVSALSKSLA